MVFSVNPDPLAILENRIEQLECIFGITGEETIDKPIMDTLLEVESTLDNACSGYEKIKEINKRLDELNAYLDPQYVNTISDIKMKTDYILENEPTIRQYCKNMEQCKELLPVLDSDALVEIPKHSALLDSLLIMSREAKEKSDETEKSLQEMLETFNELSLNLMEKLVVMNKKLDSVQKPKKK